MKKLKLITWIALTVIGGVTGGLSAHFGYPFICWQFYVIYGVVMAPIFYIVYQVDWFWEDES